MQQQFVLEGRDLREVAPGDGNIAVFTAPTAEERRFLVKFFGIDEHDPTSAFDPEEIARFEYDRETETTTIIWSVRTLGRMLM